MIELERTFLPKQLPTGIEKCKSKEMLDIYYPKSAKHPCLRLRKNGDEYMLTKKTPPNENDRSVQHEQTITLTKKEFDAFAKLDGKRLEKMRYLYNHNGFTMEIDVFRGTLSGLVLVDVEFSSEREMKVFKMPDFCIAEVTNSDFLAGGMLAGKKYSEISTELAVFGYKKPL